MSDTPDRVVDEAVELPMECKLHCDGREVTVKISVPADVSVRYDVMWAVAKNENRAFASALACCWGKLARQCPYGHDVMEHGGRVIQLLTEQGFDYLEVVAAGRLCWAHISAGLAPAKRVREVEDFSDPPEAGSGG